MVKVKSLAKNTMYKTILNICNIIIPVIIGPYILRVLDRSYYDLFNKTNADFQLFLIIGALGVYNYGVREISKIRDDKEKCSKFFTELMIIGVISNIIVCAIYIIYALFFTTTSTEFVLCMILSFQFFANLFNFEWINEANENYGFIAIKSIFVRVLYLILIFVLVKKSDDIIWYAILLVGSAVFNTFLSYIYIRKTHKFNFTGLNFKKHIKPLLLIFIIANINLLYTQLDKILLGNLISDSEVTRYQIPHYISGLIYGLIIPIVVVSLPRFANLLYVKGKDEFLKLYKKITSLFMLMFIPCIVGLFMLSKEIILLYGSNTYKDCIPSLYLFAFAQLIGAGNYLFGDAMLYINGKEKMLVLFNLIGGVVNFAGDLILYALGVFNSETAILTLILAYFIVDIMCYYYAKKYLQYKINFFNKKIYVYLLVSLLFIPIILLIKYFNVSLILTVLISVVGCSLVYLGLLLIFKDANALEIKNFLMSKFKKK